jgi:hypothetical protein
MSPVRVAINGYRRAWQASGRRPDEAMVVPENVDAIRALAGIEPDGDKSISAIDATLGLRASLP